MAVLTGIVGRDAVMLHRHRTVRHVGRAEVGHAQVAAMAALAGGGRVRVVRSYNFV